MSRETRENFFNQNNEQMLDRLLYDDVRRRTGATLDDRQKQRLVKTVKHYMGEVYRVNANQTVQYMNKEVLTAVIPDYMSYLRRESESQTSTKTDVEVVTSSDPLRTDVGSRFALMQEARKDQKDQPPPPPDFRVPLDDEQAPAIDLFEQVKKLRQAEAERDARSMEEQKMKQSTELVPLRPIEAAAVIRQKTLESELPVPNVPPDMRAVLFGTNNTNNIGRMYDQNKSGLAEANPTIAVPQLIGRKPVLPQDVIQREDDVVNYKENEFNLFCYSADRNWITNTGENRYNFSVTFNAGNPVGQTFRNQTNTQIKFKNITRIELVKIMMPVEGLEVMIDASGTIPAKTTLNANLLSFPYLTVYCPELDTNNVGTNYHLDNAFGVVQYDANWISDNNYSSQRGGYIAMIPKFMKCQKVYYPTPLSTLQKLTIRIQRPDGSVLSTVPDSLVVSGFTMSQYITGANIGTGPNYYTGGASGLSPYIWIQTSSWFSRFMFTVGDRVLLQNITLDPSIYTAATGNAPADFLNFIQNPQGLLVVNIGYYDGSKFNAGPNSVGYANYIIVDSRYNDPTTGVTTVSPFGGNATVAGSFSSAISGQTGKVSAGGVLNLSHQTQVVFRVITRDMDAASRLRPDNLN
jgi:hypothetical protein